MPLQPASSRKICREEGYLAFFAPPLCGILQSCCREACPGGIMASGDQSVKHSGNLMHHISEYELPPPPSAVKIIGYSFVQTLHHIGSSRDIHGAGTNIYVRYEYRKGRVREI